MNLHVRNAWTGARRTHATGTMSGMKAAPVGTSLFASTRIRCDTLVPSKQEPSCVYTPAPRETVWVAALAALCRMWSRD